MRRRDREVNEVKGIEEIIRGCRTCHVAMFDGDYPYVVPLSFGYKFDEGDILELYFHSAYEGRKIDILKRCGSVCFEISQEGEAIRGDNPCEWGYYYSSVIGLGKAVFIEDTAEKCKALSIIFKHQSGQDVVFDNQQAEKVCVFKIISKDYRGKKKPG